MDHQNREMTALSLVPSSVAHLHPEEAVWEAMLAGWAAQMRSRGLSPSTVDPRLAMTRRFMIFSAEYPWAWSADDLDSWSTELRSSGIAQSTLRSYQASVRMFCDFVTDARYGWAERCLEMFGTHPVQVCHEWNTLSHTVDFEGRPSVRPLTRGEIQQLFDFADDQVESAQRLGRKGWLAAWRDATLFKIIYAFGLRRREVAMLDVMDFHHNPAAPEFGRFGICQVRYGKAMRGSPPRRRSVVTVWPWTATILEEYLDQVRLHYARSDGPALWPTERGTRVGVDYVTRRFAEYRNEAGLPSELHPHCLRHSYVTHFEPSRVWCTPS